MKNAPADNQHPPKFTTKSESNTSFALLNSNRVHIDDVEDFKDKNFKCPGCNARVSAVNNSEDRLNYFRHYVPPGGKKPPCAFYEETYRHKIAKDILLKSLVVKLPTLNKYSDDGLEKVRLKKPSLFKAKYAKAEKRIYFDSLGKLIIEPKKEKEKNIIQPDVIFYDENNQPVLFIEIRATHKCNDEKVAKLRELKIDTIEILIPPEWGEKEITDYLTNSSTNTKWLFNNQEYECKYESLTDYYSERIQGNFREEAYTFSNSIICEIIKTQRLIRRIREYSETDEFGETKRKIKRRITKEQESGFIKLKLEQEINDSIRNREERAKGVVEGEFEQEEREFREYYIDLEHRYKRKRRELEKSNNVDVDEDVKRLFNVNQDLREKTRRVEQDTVQQQENTFRQFDSNQIIRNEEADIDELIEQEREEIDRIEGILNGTIEPKKTKVDRNTREEKTSIERDREELRNIKNRIEQERENQKYTPVKFESPKPTIEEVNRSIRVRKFIAKQTIQHFSRKYYKDGKSNLSKTSRRPDYFNNAIQRNSRELQVFYQIKQLIFTHKNMQKLLSTCKKSAGEKWIGQSSF